jgi:hypothetical protein
MMMEFNEFIGLRITQSKIQQLRPEAGIPFVRVLLTPHGLSEVPFKLIAKGPKEFIHQLLFPREMPVHGPRGDTGFSRDDGYSRPIVAPFREEPERRLQDTDSSGMKTGCERRFIHAFCFRTGEAG